jgi:serine/threonine-protein kinase
MTDLDGRSDQYSLAATLYHMLTGIEPFDAPNPTVTMLGHVNGQLADLREACPEAPAGLVDVMTRMLAKDPADRYPGLNAVMDEIERVKTGQKPAGEALDPQLSSLGREKARNAAPAAALAHPALASATVPPHRYKTNDTPSAPAATNPKTAPRTVPWPWYLLAGAILFLVLFVIIWALSK